MLKKTKNLTSSIRVILGESGVGTMTMTVKPTIEQGKITSIEVNGVSLPLRRSIELNEFADFHQKLLALSEFVNFGGSTGWTTDEIEAFLELDITDKAHEFFEILAVDGGWVRREVLQGVLKIKGRALAGVLSSPGQYFSRREKDPLYESQRRKEEGDAEEYHYYRIKPEYLPSFRKIFEIEEERGR